MTYTKDELTDLTRKEQEKLADKLGVSYSKKTREAELVDAIFAAQNVAPKPVKKTKVVESDNFRRR